MHRRCLRSSHGISIGSSWMLRRQRWLYLILSIVVQVMSVVVLLLLLLHLLMSSTCRFVLCSYSAAAFCSCWLWGVNIIRRTTVDVTAALPTHRLQFPQMTGERHVAKGRGGWRASAAAAAALVVQRTQIVGVMVVGMRMGMRQVLMMMLMRMIPPVLVAWWCTDDQRTWNGDKTAADVACWTCAREKKKNERTFIRLV